MRGMSTTYYGAYALERIHEAQQVLRWHVTSAWTGCCLKCGRPGPCTERIEAEQTLDRYRRLPQRLPGASLHGLLSPFDSADGFDWFVGAPEQDT